MRTFGCFQLGILPLLCGALALPGCGGSSGGSPPRLYSLGATVTGLRAEGLSVEALGSTVSVASGANTVALASNLVAGTRYTVQVATQPSGETCSVSNGSGVVSANVADVLVTCVTNTYPVSASISGLKASGLVLTYNGCCTFSVPANVTRFTLDDYAPYGSSYEIAVQAQPTEEVCTVSEGSGIVTGNVTNPAITCDPAFTTSVLYSFAGGSDGARPVSALIQANDGNLYGTTSGGGADNAGTVFKITRHGLESVLYSFTGGSDGGIPQAALIQAADGNFYGTTSSGGAYSAGTVFKITPAGVETVLYSFAGGGDGAHPMANLLQAKDGNFYGTTEQGGSFGTGTVFRITPGGSETVLQSLGGANGQSPVAGLIQASDGDFYGTTEYGGALGHGIVFKLTLGGVETVVFDFGGGGDGGPEGGLIQTPDGDFHGTTDGGGIGHGSVFTITPSGIESGLYFFGDVSGDGWIPQAGLIQGTDGNLYGTTNEGGPGGGGTVFDITPAGVETVLYSFTAGSVDGDAPKASLIQGSDGDFYGTTELGGTNDAGTVFKVVPLQ